MIYRPIKSINIGEITKVVRIVKEAVTLLIITVNVAALMTSTVHKNSAYCIIMHITGPLVYQLKPSILHNAS